MMRFERTILALGTVALAGVSAPALAAIDPLDAIGICSRISKKDARLECYDQVARDGASGRLQSSAAPQGFAPPPQAPIQPPSQNWSPPPPPGGVTASGPGWAAPPAPPAVQPGTQPSASAAGGFGGDSMRRGTDERRSAEGGDSIQAEVASSTDNGLQQWRIALADGAVWQMTERVSQFRPPAPQEVVTIRRGAMGGFLMDVGKQASVRVMRVK
jgi:hypothetical protein